MEESSTWKALPEMGYKCRACSAMIRCTHKGSTYVMWCPSCASTTVINATTDREAFSAAVQQGTIFMEKD